ncbi:MAG: ChaN family lipoprotein [Proteobacteria bacterium]|nr:ChaN family lipoprotein [Pseudomonadota bacterium]
MKKFFITLFIILTFVNCHGEESPKFVRISGYESVSFKSFIDDISKGQIIFVGEQHSELAHHRVQLMIIEELKNRGYKIAVGLEMFREKEQNVLDEWVNGKLDELSFIKKFYENWGSNWKLYGDIFKFAKEKNIPLVGLNVPKEITKKVGQYGFDSLTKDELKNLPPNVTCQIDKKYLDLLKNVFGHKAENNKNFNNFCEAQVLWDQAMAFYIDRFLKNNPDYKMIVLAGTIHSWKYGIPKQVQKFGKYKTFSVIQDNPFMERDISSEEADYFVIHK